MELELPTNERAEALEYKIGETEAEMIALKTQTEENRVAADVLKKEERAATNALKKEGYGASLGGTLCDTHNPTLGLFSRTI